MSRNSRPHFRDFRDGYATCRDFCEAFRRNTTQLYLLAFLLTANHQEAQECFVGAMDKAFAERNVFKGWEESWSKRCLIEHAIGAIIFQSGRREAWRDVWFQEGGENKLQTFLDASHSIEIDSALRIRNDGVGRIFRQGNSFASRPHTGVRSQPANRSASAISRT